MACVFVGPPLLASGMSCGLPIPIPPMPQDQSLEMFVPSYRRPDVLRQFCALFARIELFRTTSSEKSESAGPYRPIPGPGALNAMVLLLMVTYALWLYSTAGPLTWFWLMVLLVAWNPYRTRIAEPGPRLSSTVLFSRSSDVAFTAEP